MSWVGLQQAGRKETNMEFQGGGMMRGHHFENLGLAGKIKQKRFLNE